MLRLSWILQLSLFCSVVSGQKMDSIPAAVDSVNVLDSLPENPLATARTYLEQWRSQVDHYYTAFDSVKREVAWQRRQEDRGGATGVQSYIRQVRPSVLLLRGKVDVLRKQTVSQDSTASSWSAVQDSVATLQRDIESLLLDMDDLTPRHNNSKTLFRRHKQQRPGVIGKA